MSRALLLMVGSITLMSCVITRDPSYDPPPNYPACVQGTTETPTNRFYTQMLGEAPVGADAGASAQELTLSAIVRDPNIDDELEALLFVNRDPINPGDGLVLQFSIPTNGKFERERVRLTVPNAELTQDCNVVELHVSRSFSAFPELAPVGTAIDGMQDLGVASWFVGAVGEDGIFPTVDTCPGVETSP